MNGISPQVIGGFDFSIIARAELPKNSPSIMADIDNRILMFIFITLIISSKNKVSFYYNILLLEYI